MNHYDITTVKQPYITWAIVNNKVEWMEGQVEHKEWLKNTFGIAHRAYEDTVAGFVKNNRDGKIEIVYFKGSGFDECEIDNKHLAQVLLISDLYYDFEQIHLCSGLKLRKNSDTRRTNGAYKILTKIDISNRVVSIKQILDYEDRLVEIINSTVHSNPDIFIKELELCHESLKICFNSDMSILDHDFKRRLVTYRDLL